MPDYDFCLAWNWEHDADFVRLLESACQAQGLSLLQITPDNLDAILQSLNGNPFTFCVFIDRASDVDERFLPIVEWARTQANTRINPYKTARHAWDKAAMDEKFQNAGLHMPNALVVPAYNHQPEIPPLDLRPLGECFAIKPTHGGGGKGVVTQATAWEQVLAARKEFPDDQYLLQAHVVPATMDSRPAWFRVIYCAGQIFPCWWHPITHLYTPVTQAEEESYSLQPLRDIAMTIRRVSQLELFSTEVALTPEGDFMVIDHVNDPIDLRLQSRVADGIPDEIARAIADQLASLATRHNHSIGSK